MYSRWFTPMGSSSLTNGVLNETTGTIHKQETVGSELETVCGATYNLPEGALRLANIGTAIDMRHTTKCGRCFDDGRGY